MHVHGKFGTVSEFDVTDIFEDKKIPKYLKVLDDLFERRPTDCVKKTWLDIGCGHGEFMVALKRYFKNDIVVKGTDLNIYKQASARSKGLDVDCFNIHSHDKCYDIISILNVYSHLSNPPLFLNWLKKLFNPNGELIIETSDTSYLWASDHSRPFDLPDHVSVASEKIITDILLRLGFDIILVKKYTLGKLEIDEILEEVIKFFLPKYQS